MKRKTKFFNSISKETATGSSQLIVAIMSIKSIAYASKRGIA